MSGAAPAGGSRGNLRATERDLAMDAMTDAAIDAAIDAATERGLAITGAIDGACARIAPTWPLDRFIAVNPLWGWIDAPLPEVAAKLASCGGSTILAPRGLYRDAWREGRILPEHLEVAAARAGFADLGPLVAWLDASEPGVTTRASVVDLAELRLVWRSSLRELLVDAISRHAASFFDARVGADREGGLYASWRRLVASGAWATGLDAIRSGVAGLPEDPRETIATALDTLGVARSEHEGYLTSLLLDVGGWAAWCAYRRWTARLSGGDDEAIVGLLAIRVACELGLLVAGGRGLEARWRRAMASWAAVDEKAQDAQREGWIWQDALELAYQRPLARRLASAEGATSSVTPRVQAAFCIDVRSEVFRRALEAQSPRITTLGCAGFFGMPVEYLPLGASGARPQLPGLLAPAMRVIDVGAPAAAADKRRARLGLGAAWKALKSGALSTFAFVDALGPFYAGALAIRAVASEPAPSIDCVGLLAREHGKPRLGMSGSGEALSLDARCDLAAGMLRAMSLTVDFARVVLFCGHGSATRNNPYAAGLDCGACCGQTGEVNARAAVALLNDPAVRRGLRERGITVPESTRFVAGLHVTTTDEVKLFDLDELPVSHEADVATLREQLAGACKRARAERAKRLGVEETSEAAIEAAVTRRAGDWSEVRPEWGLARNASFVIAPRGRTKGLSLEGRSFLHDYVAARDEGYATLELLLTAPMVVAHWINFQYYASTVDNRRFGSGNKVLHDVVGGTLGVFEGNGGDLRIGLPMQSLHDGTRWVHEPLRLSVFVEAPREAIDGVLSNHDHVRGLVDHGWLHLFQLGGEGVWQRRAEGWEAV